MRFLADESCDFAVVKALRQVEHDVTVVANSVLRLATTLCFNSHAWTIAFC